MNRLLLVALLAVAANAFQASLPRTVAPPKPAFVSSTARKIILTDDEVEQIMTSAGDCAAGECSIDDVSELIHELKDVQVIMEGRLAKIMNMISHLQHINEKEERKTDQVRQFVRDMLQVFNTDKPGFPLSGFSGDIGDGPKTAYDALPPKKWSPGKQ